MGDAGRIGRMLYRIDADAVVVADVFEKKSRVTPAPVLDEVQRRLRRYDAAATEKR